MKQKRMLIGPFWFHRKEQWDLDCMPWLAIHFKTLNSSTRLFCIWRWGIYVRPFSLTPRAFSTGRKVWKFKQVRP
jgi:hypothetical protein